MPLDTRIPLMATQQRQSPMESYARALQIKSAQRQMASQDADAKAKEGRTNALRTAIDPTTGALDYGRAEAALMGLGDVEGAVGIRRQGTDERRLDMQAQSAEMKTKLAAIEAEARLLGGVADEAGYQAARQRAQSMGLGEDWPEVYDPNIVKQAIEAGLDTKSRLQLGMDREKMAATERYRGATLKQGDERNAIARSNAGREPLIEVYDPQSPTGTSYVPRSQAAGRPGKPPSNGITVTTDENGNPIVQIGGQGGAKPTSSVATETQKDVISASGALERLDSIAKSYKAEYLTTKGRVAGWVGRQADMLGAASDDQKKFIQGRREFTQKVDQEFNAYRKEITGAAAAMAELKDLKKAMISTDLSPAEFEAAYTTYRDSVARMLRLKQSILRDGVPVGSREFNKRLDDAWVGGADDSMDARGAELEAQGLSEDEAYEQLMREGYRQ